jgi:hypothetical protein
MDSCIFIILLSSMKNNLDIFRIQTNNVAPQKGRILIAEPFLPGNYFNRSVILLVAFSDKGAVGFILNKKVELAIHDILPGFPNLMPMFTLADQLPQIPFILSTSWEKNFPAAFMFWGIYTGEAISIF